MTKKVSAFENETISMEMVKEIVTDLQRDKLEMLSFRNCMFTDKAYKKTMKAVGACTSLALRHLGLHVGIVCDSFRVQVLAHALQGNASLVGLHLHGNKLSDIDFETLYPHLKSHPRITTLDLSDCNIGDEAMALICETIKESKDVPGLQNLFLSHNPKITADGWTKLAIALASGSGLRSIEIDYNEIEDSVACCLATALPGAAYLETLDMECTAITERTGQVLLHLVKCYNLKLKSLNLKGTQVLGSTQEAIKLQLAHAHGSSTSEHISDDECSLATSEPPLNEDGDNYMGTDEFGLSTNDVDPKDNITRTESFETKGIPVLEISPSNGQENRLVGSNGTGGCNSKEGTKSMSNVNARRSSLNAAGFEIKKAFSFNDLTDGSIDLQRGISEKEMKEFEEYEAYIPDKESLKHRDSIATLVEEMKCIDDFEHDGLHSLSASIHSVKMNDEADKISKSGNHSPLFYARPMSAPMSRNDTLNEASGLLQAKTSTAGITDLASLIRQKNKKETEQENNFSKRETEDMEVQDIN